MSKSFILKIGSLITSLGVTCIGNYAMAQEVPGNNCVGLDKNELWQITFSEFSEEYSLGRYENAEIKIKQLLDICSSSPLVNYSAGMTYTALKQTEKAKKAYLDAIKNTQYFVVEDDFYKKMLDAYYKEEHGDELCEMEDLKKCQADHEAANQQIQALNERLNKSIEGLVIEDLKSRELKKYSAIMWTGTGVGIAGIGLLVAGVVMMTTNDRVDKLSFNPNGQGYIVTLNKTYVPGAILLGIGSGLLAGGAALAGFGGYHYTHAIADDVAMGMNINPGQLEFGMTF